MSTVQSDFLATLENTIRNRLESPVDGSYTSQLVAAGEIRIAQKVGEEAIELALASVSGDCNDVIGEAADLLYHVLVLLNFQDIRLADVIAALEARHEP